MRRFIYNSSELNWIASLRLNFEQFLKVEYQFLWKLKAISQLLSLFFGFVTLEDGIKKSFYKSFGMIEKFFKFFHKLKSECRSFFYFLLLLFWKKFFGLVSTLVLKPKRDQELGAVPTTAERIVFSPDKYDNDRAALATISQFSRARWNGCVIIFL